MVLKILFKFLRYLKSNNCTHVETKKSEQKIVIDHVIMSRYLQYTCLHIKITFIFLVLGTSDGSRKRPATLLKKRLWHRCFPVNSAKFLRTPFLQNTSGGCFFQPKNVLSEQKFGHSSWPKCGGFCKPIETEEERLCCRDNSKILEENYNGNILCMCVCIK